MMINHMKICNLKLPGQCQGYQCFIYFTANCLHDIWSLIYQRNIGYLRHLHSITELMSKFILQPYLHDILMAFGFQPLISLAGYDPQQQHESKIKQVFASQYQRSDYPFLGLDNFIQNSSYCQTYENFFSQLVNLCLAQLAKLDIILTVQIKTQQINQLQSIIKLIFVIKVSSHKFIKLNQSFRQLRHIFLSSFMSLSCIMFKVTQAQLIFICLNFFQNAYYYIVTIFIYKFICLFIEVLFDYMDCYYHPKQPLTNFCNNPQCALPLCPKCINVHLAQSNVQHQILPLREKLKFTIEQLSSGQEALIHQLQQLSVQYDPQNVIKDYSQKLSKYRMDAIDQINRHYDYLQKEIWNEICYRYSHHIQKLFVPLQHQLQNIKKLNKQIKQNHTNIETLISVTSQKTMFHIGDLLSIVKDKKLCFNNQLPSLKDGQAGKLNMTIAQRGDFFPNKSPIIMHSSPYIQNNKLYEQRGKYRISPQRIDSYHHKQPNIMSYPSPKFQNPHYGNDRISNLQARLHSLGYD